MGLTGPVAPEMSALYRFLCNVLPEHVAATTYIMSAAAYVGEDAQYALLAGFDVVMDRTIKRKHVEGLDVWRRCMRLIEASPRFPEERIVRELSRHLSADKVRSMFKGSWDKPYTERMRQRHREVILDLENSHLLAHKPKPTATIQSLLDLQEFIR
jgi:hypothetical protein